MSGKAHDPIDGEAVANGQARLRLASAWVPP